MLRCLFESNPKGKTKASRMCGTPNSKPYITGAVGGPVAQPVWRCDVHKPKKKEEVNWWDGSPKAKS
jgi:hypothetical protein